MNGPGRFFQHRGSMEASGALVDDDPALGGFDVVHERDADGKEPRVIGEILPEAAKFAEAFADAPDVMLFPEETALLVRAVKKRRREFATGRHCARSALGALGMPPAPILPGEAGAPLWPPGIVGSITHCAGYRAAAVARAHEVLTIGIDAEPDQLLTEEVLKLISLPAERARLRDLATAAPGICWDRLLFSAKESVYKAWFPLARRWLGFADADITINAANGIDKDGNGTVGTFEARLLVSAPVVGGAPLTGFTGRWLARDGVVLTAITVPAEPAACCPPS
jgi:4'-phosphopantetheinyl transferase EntD